MIIRATFENGNQQFVTRLVRNDNGKITDAATSIYQKSVDCDVDELSALFPSVQFEVVDK